MAFSFDKQCRYGIDWSYFHQSNGLDSAGTHILRVKAWGNGGALLRTDLSISTVAGVSVQTPSNNAHVTSHFLFRHRLLRARTSPPTAWRGRWTASPIIFPAALRA